MRISCVVIVVGVGLNCWLLMPNVFINCDGNDSTAVG